MTRSILLAKTSIVLAFSFFASAPLLAQNHNEATNGLKEPTNTSVGLGGTLTEDTKIDLGTSFWFKLSKNTQDYLTVLNGGNVGIGTSSPAYLLDVNGTGRFSNGILLGTNTISPQGNDLYFTSPNYNYYFTTLHSGTDARLQSNGYFKFLSTGVKINSLATPAGTTKMVVTDENGLLSFQDIPSGGSGSFIQNQNTAAQTGRFWLKAPIDATYDSEIKFDETGFYFKHRTGDMNFTGNTTGQLNWTTSNTINFSGTLNVNNQLGIGTNGVIAMENNSKLFSDWYNLNITTGAGAGDIILSTNNAVRARLNGAGKLLLNTTDQGDYKLQVGGPVFVDGGTTTMNRIYGKYGSGNIGLLVSDNTNAHFKVGFSPANINIGGNTDHIINLGGTNAQSENFTPWLTTHSGGVNITSLKTSSSAPVTTGTNKMVVTDQNGLLSYADIPGAGSLAPLLQTGKIIYVDKNNPNATDNRSGISRYSMAQPFATIQAAYYASGGVGSEMYGDIIYVRPGIYSENLSITLTTTTGYNLTNVFIFDNSILDGGTNSAIVFNQNFDATIILNNSTIKNTGTAADREGTATIKAYTARLKIFGNSNLSSLVSSTEAHAFYDGSNAANYFDRVAFTSVNGAGYYAPYAGSGNFSHCKIVSTNSFAMRGYSYVVDYSIIKGNSYGILLGDNIRYNIKLSDSYIEATNGIAIGGGALGGDDGEGSIKNCELVSYNEAINFGTGNMGIVYHFIFENNKIKILNPAINNAIALPLSNRTDLIIKATSITSTVPLFSSDFRNNYQVYIKETNTLVENNSFYVGVKAGFGEQNPTANLHVKGTAILDIPTGSLNTNDLLYSKDIATGQMKLVPASVSGGGTVSLPSNQIAYGSAGNTITGNSNLTYDGSTFAINTANLTPSSYAQYKLAVNGNAIFTRVKVRESSQWADYVFEPGYKLPTLQEVEAFIKKHKHLPEVPSAEEVKKEGIDIGDNQAVLLKKIEELTLYVIEQNKEIETLKTQNQTLAQKLEQLNKLEEEIKLIKELLRK